MDCLMYVTLIIHYKACIISYSDFFHQKLIKINFVQQKIFIGKNYFYFLNLKQLKFGNL